MVAGAGALVAGAVGAGLALHAASSMPVLALNDAARNRRRLIMCRPPMRSTRRQGTSPGIEAPPRVRRAVRLGAAERITSFDERDTALAVVARAAAKAGNAVRAKQAVGKITAFSSRDRTALEAARELLKNGLRAEAVDIAQTITSFSERDAAMKELAR